MPARNHGGGRCSPGLAGWPMFPHPWDPAGMPAVFTNTQTYRASIQALFGRPGLPLIASTSSRSDTSTMRARLCINPKLEVITTLCDQYVCHTWHPWGKRTPAPFPAGRYSSQRGGTCGNSPHSTPGSHPTIHADVARRGTPTGTLVAHESDVLTDTHCVFASGAPRPGRITLLTGGWLKQDSPIASPKSDPMAICIGAMPAS